jgi:hypothetical protein
MQFNNGKYDRPSKHADTITLPEVEFDIDRGFLLVLLGDGSLKDRIANRGILLRAQGIGARRYRNASFQYLRFPLRQGIKSSIRKNKHKVRNKSFWYSRMM